MNEEDQKLPNENRRPQVRRRKRLKFSFVLCVVFPLLIGTIYTTFFASERYVARAGFSVRSMKGSSGSDLFGAFTGLVGNSSTASDAYIVLEYLRSREVVERLEEDIGFRRMYGDEKVDLFSRLWVREIERVVKYWERRIDVSYDPTSQIINFEVQAFSSAEAKQVADLLLSYVQELVNTLSEAARQEAVRYAGQEVERYEARLIKILREIASFREKEASLDPSVSALAQIETVVGLERELIELRTRIEILKQSLDADAPSLRVLQRQADALEQEMAKRNGGAMNTASSGNLSQQLMRYEELQVEKEFAQKAYASSLGSLETARVEAGRRQRFLAVYDKPALPEYPLYPRKVLYPVLLSVFSTVLWGIGVLIIYSIRDHIS
ncbi:hypothetical protein P4B35_21425 [Pontiellaceae bacterium B12227]|nr:hypothetical protein [Pontiellaceae bacterium B12227]